MSASSSRSADEGAGGGTVGGPASAVSIRRYTRRELAACHGRTGGRPILIAYEGKVYDVTDSFPWRFGFHWACAYAGQDLTEKMKGAPHGPELLDRVPCVGILVD